MNPTGILKRPTKVGETKVHHRFYCNPCRYIRETTDERRERIRLRSQTLYYTVYKTNPEYLAKRHEYRRNRQKRMQEQAQREWEEMYGTMPPLKHVPSSTSKFALEVYAEVFNALANYNIKFKAEFN